MGRLASDIGGTFTDLVYFDEESGALKLEKALTTPEDLTRGVEDTIRLAQIDPDKVDFFVHGGTTVINAITERKGAKTALVTRPAALGWPECSSSMAMALIAAMGLITFLPVYLGALPPIGSNMLVPPGSGMMFPPAATPMPP